MNKVYLTAPDILALLEWRDAHKEAVRHYPVVFEQVKIIGPNGIITATEQRNMTVDFTCAKQGVLLGKFKYHLLARVPEITQGDIHPDDIQSAITMYCTLSAYLAEREPRYIEQPPRTAHRKSSVPQKLPRRKTKPQTIVIGEYIRRSSPTAPQGHHRSPDHAFEVRGHYRHYKSGKRAWIAPFTKCEDKAEKQSKTYRFNGII